ncbi:MAG: ribosome-associated translation inhibitor RaiA [Endomicrobiia bacterium]
MEDIKIISRNLEVNKEIKEYIEKKFKKITRYIPKISSTEITLKKEKYTYNVEVLIHTYHKKMIKVSTQNKVLHSAIDEAIDKVKELLVKYKEKTIVSVKKHSKINKENLPPIEDFGLKDETKYTKNKIFLEKMTEQEAVEKLASTNENILFFFNIDTNNVSVVKKIAKDIEVVDLYVEK